ncbi:hypothetical protein BS78_02G313000 [Paspalum vaginatum]|nr:hypothetical protein BS78_02G313000 [Paspalum vaginatum]
MQVRITTELAMEAGRVRQELAKRNARRAAGLGGDGGGIPVRRHARSEPLSFLGFHHQPYLGLHLLGRDQPPLPPNHFHADLGFPHHEQLVHLLLRVHRPAKHRHARRDPLQRRVPPAVRHERARRPVMQHLHLRRPVLDDEAPAAGALQEPVWQEGVEVRVRARVEQPRLCAAATRARGSHHPQEAVAGPLQAEGHLPQLLLRVGGRADASEAEEHDAALWLPVEPRQALVLLSCLTAAGAGSARHQRPDAVHRRHPSLPAGENLRVPESSHRPRLQRRERVHQDAVGLRVPAHRVQRRPVHLTVGILERLAREVRRRHGRHAAELERGVSELPEAGLAFRAHPRQLEEHRDRGRVGGEEGVRRDAELPGDVERVDGGRVHDHRVDGPGRQRAEELAEPLVVASDDLEVPEERLLRVVCGVLVHGEVDERYRDRVAFLQEGVGELHHGDEVADEEPGVKNDRLLHGGHGFRASTFSSVVKIVDLVSITGLQK